MSVCLSVCLSVSYLLRIMSDDLPLKLLSSAELEVQFEVG